MVEAAAAAGAAASAAVVLVGGGGGTAPIPVILGERGLVAAEAVLRPQQADSTIPWVRCSFKCMDRR